MDLDFSRRLLHYRAISILIFVYARASLFLCPSTIIYTERFFFFFHLSTHEDFETIPVPMKSIRQNRRA